MSFKLHLMIVCFIIVIVYVAWQAMNNAPAPAPAVEAKSAQHVITVSHASWGLGCRDYSGMNGSTTRDAFVDSSDTKVRQDNVLSAVALLCNGKQKCDVAVDATVLGEDPFPTCNPKMLEIEYRCFSYDRPWIAKAMSGSVSLHCDTPTAKQ